MIFAERLQKARKSKNVSQKELADALGMSKSAFSRYENGDREPRLETLANISIALETPVEYLLGLTDELPTDD